MSIGTDEWSRVYQYLVTFSQQKTPRLVPLLIDFLFGFMNNLRLFSFSCKAYKSRISREFAVSSFPCVFVNGVGMHKIIYMYMKKLWIYGR